MPVSFASPSMTVILCLAHQNAHAIAQLPRDFSRPLDDFRKIDFQIACRKPEFVQAMNQVPDFGGAQQRLGGYAAPVQADAAKVFAFNNRSFQAQLRAADRTDIATRPAAGHNHIKLVIRHFPLPDRGLPARTFFTKMRARTPALRVTTTWTPVLPETSSASAENARPWRHRSRDDRRTW